MAIIGKACLACAPEVFKHPVGGARSGGSVFKTSWNAESYRLINCSTVITGNPVFKGRSKMRIGLVGREKDAVFPSK
jgi:hypothetical protein